MAVISIPTLQEIRDRVNADVKARISTELRPELPNSVIGVFAETIAAAEYSNMLAIQRAADAIFFSSAQGDALAALAAPFGIQRAASSPAVGTIRMDFPFSSSLSLNSPWVITFSDTSGNQYRASGQRLFFEGRRPRGGGNNPTVITLPRLDLRVETVATGESANASSGLNLTITDVSIPNFAGAAAAEAQIRSATTIVTSTAITGGATGESDDQLRQRFLSVVKTPTAGGTVPEWVNWTREVSGVTRAFVRSISPGTINIYPVYDAQQNDLPSSTQLTEIRTHLEQYRGAEIELRILPFTPKGVDVNVSVYPNNESITAAVIAAIEDSVRAFNTLGRNFEFRRFWQAVAGLAGVETFAITEPTSDITLTEFELLVPNVTVSTAPAPSTLPNSGNSGNSGQNKGSM